MLRLHTSFNPLNYSLQSNALLSSNIVHSSVPRLLLISDNYFHGLLKARSHERLSCGCQLEYLISYFGLHHVVSLGSFANSLTLIGLSFSLLRWFLPRCPLLGVSKLRLLRVSHTRLDKGWCISPWPRFLLVDFQKFRNEKRKFLVPSDPFIVSNQTSQTSTKQNWVVVLGSHLHLITRCSDILEQPSVISQV